MELQWSRRVVQRQQAGEVVILRDSHPTIGRKLDTSMVVARSGLLEADPALSRWRPDHGDNSVGIAMRMRRGRGDCRGTKPKAEENER